MNLAHLKALAEKATPIVHDKDFNFYSQLTGHDGIPMVPQKKIEVPMTRIDLEFYTAFNPSTALALIAKLERYEGALKAECYCTMADTTEATCDPCEALKDSET